MALSLLAAALMKMNCGMKPTSAVPTSAQRRSVISASTRYVAQSVTAPRNTEKKRARCSARIAPRHGQPSSAWWIR